jgi:hypothetical protein
LERLLTQGAEIFTSPDVHAGRYDNAIAVNDIAPTLATMLDVETPSGPVGRVLTEMLGQWRNRVLRQVASVRAGAHAERWDGRLITSP